MAGFKTNIAAMNAARKEFGKDWKAHAKLEKVDGQWFVQLLQPMQSSPALQAAVAEALDADGSIEAGERENEISDQDEAEFEEAQANRAKNDAESSAPIIAEDLTAQIAAADAIANSQASEQQLPNGKVWIKLSSVPKPTKLVWHIADEMIAAAAAAGKPAPSRKEVQDECIRRGVASGTARTQYQAWKKACDESRANATKAAELSAKHNGH